MQASLAEEGARVTLLGGLLRDGALVRDVRLRPITGRVELDLATVLERDSVAPRRAARCICIATHTIGGELATPELVDGLCVADHVQLLVEIARFVDGDLVWISTACRRCSEPFDFRVSRGALPTQPAGEAFPFARVTLRGQEAVFRVPTGADVRWIGERGGRVGARELLSRCLVSPSKGELTGLIEELTEEELDCVDEALDATSPDLGTRVSAACPGCGHEQTVSLDMREIPALTVDGLLDQVHALAFHYHWAESDILGLPRDRRRRYLDRVDRERGLHG